MNEISRVNRSKAAAQANYDRLSRYYDLLAGSSEEKFKLIGLEMLAAKPGEKILEIGCGTGRTLPTLARAVGSDGRVCGVDLSTGMLEASRREVINTGQSNTVELECADAVALPFGENCIDAVFTSFTLELFDTPEIPLVLQECRRILRPGGRICVVSMSALGKATLATRLYAWAHERMPSSVDCRPIFVEASLQAAGFKINQTKLTKMWGLPVEIVLAEAQRLP